MSVGRFIHETLPSRVLFGVGTLGGLPEEAERLGIKRALVLSTPGQAEQGLAVCDLLGVNGAGLFSGARMHTPTDVSEQACARVRELGADGVIAIGGGSTIGLAKAIALRTDLPQVVIPTTYAGSEVTPILGETENGLKVTRRSLKVLPETVIYDVELTLGLPVALSVTSGLNAIAHAAEALYAPNVSPVVAMIAEEGVRALVGALPRLANDPANVVARSDALEGAWLCGICLGLVGMALHHKLCHVLGGTFDLPHAETHSVVLPHVLAYNLEVVPDARNRLARAVGHADPALALHQLAARLGAPTSLASLGMPESGVADAARLAVATPYPNPRPFVEDDIARILSHAWAGSLPSVL
ncbi:iron-containing alcohol dehydrogenase (plasmid) [Rhizorhabdus wittichii RW1]|jgi:alcohol dehydrogenase class IV|uniref:Iron-containing alcohol dehydrogenase n=1 Tax=Rhizorhabdus wittichii (strain DSM 6014 / CCUG 31198 / JCM 15750 / NBRC 105917 / EY 4224 / RW1) TaxID=392499 RepID=A0A9J9HGQ6_RHIWR|nr:iron-containing alcohol dehydrogenase [Rhizorhabdus wittichii RW1]